MHLVIAGIYNQLLVHKHTGYIMNQYEHVGEGVGHPCTVRSKLNKFEHVWETGSCIKGSQGWEPLQGHSPPCEQND